MCDGIASCHVLAGALTLPLGYLSANSRVSPLLRDVNCNSDEMYLLECAAGRENREEGDGDSDGDGGGDNDNDGNRDSDGDDRDDDECLPVSLRCDGKLVKPPLPFIAVSTYVEHA